MKILISACVAAFVACAALAPSSAHAQATNGGSMAIKSIDGLCVDVPFNNWTPGVRLTGWTCTAANNQQWAPAVLDYGNNSARELTVLFRNRTNGLCMQYNNSDKTITQEMCDGTRDNQRWLIQPGIHYAKSSDLGRLIRNQWGPVCLSTAGIGQQLTAFGCVPSNQSQRWDVSLF